LTEIIRVGIIGVLNNSRDRVMTPQEAVLELTEIGLKQPQIVSALDTKGVKTTQETISRIGTGVIKRPSFEVGAALVQLAKEQSVAPA